MHLVNGKIRQTILVWLCWALCFTGFVYFVQARISLAPGDTALSWTADWTRPGVNADKPYLNEPFMNGFVAWDSEYYLSIAIGGYRDPAMRAMARDFDWNRFPSGLGMQKDHPDWVSMNSAFMPFYPLMIRLVMTPFLAAGMSAIAAATLAGVLVSMAGTLLAMIALFHLAQPLAGRAGGFRAATYLLVFPSSCFLGLVYTEGLFLGLSFACIWMARDKRWIPAAILAFCATLTKAAGGLVLVPLLWYWLQDYGIKSLVQGQVWKNRLRLLAVAAPVLAFGLFSLVWGPDFHVVESRWYSRHLLDFAGTLRAWGQAFGWMTSHPAGLAYYLVELASLAFALGASVWLIRKDPVLGTYSLLLIGFSLTSGVAQGMHRYVLAAPALFLLPARWGKNPVFDKIWTLAGTLLMALFLASFCFDHWAG